MWLLPSLLVPHVVSRVSVSSRMYSTGLCAAPMILAELNAVPRAGEGQCGSCPSWMGSLRRAAPSFLHFTEGQNEFFEAVTAGLAQLCPCLAVSRHRSVFPAHSLWLCQDSTW